MAGKHLNIAQFANWYGREELVCVAFLITSYIAVQHSGGGPLAACLSATYHSNHLHFRMWKSDESLVCVARPCTAGITEDKVVHTLNRMTDSLGFHLAKCSFVT